MKKFIFLLALDCVASGPKYAMTKPQINHKQAESIQNGKTKWQIYTL